MTGPLRRAAAESQRRRALRLDPKVRDYVPDAVLQLEHLRQRADEFDVNHFHSDFMHLPEMLESVEIRNLRVGGTSLDLLLRRHGSDVAVNVLRREGAAEVIVSL